MINQLHIYKVQDKSTACVVSFNIILSMLHTLYQSVPVNFYLLNAICVLVELLFLLKSLQTC